MMIKKNYKVIREKNGRSIFCFPLIRGIWNEIKGKIFKTFLIIMIKISILRF